MTRPEILPPTSESLSELSSIHGHDRCVLTVYFPGSLIPETGEAKGLADLPGKLLPVAGLTRDESEHLQRSLDLWKTVVPGITLPPARGWVAVVSWLTDEAAFVQLPDTVEQAAHLDNSPFLLQAGRLLDDLAAYAVVYADHARASIFLAALGKLHDEARLRGEIKNHVRKGGWSQQRYERRRDKEIHHYCLALAGKLKELVENEELNRIVLAGDRILLNELEKKMPGPMREQVVCRLPMEGKKSEHEIFRETLTAAAEEEAREESRLLEMIVEASASGGQAVVGPAATLEALKEKRVRRLLLGPMDDVTFRRCGACGVFGLHDEPACPECGDAAYEQSAANEFMDLAFSGGSEVEFTTHVLAEIEGVGALLRW